MDSSFSLCFFIPDPGRLQSLVYVSWEAGLWMFMRSRLSDEDGDSRNKEGCPVIEESSLGKFCGPGVEQQGPLPCPCQYVEPWQVLTVLGPPALPKLPCASLAGKEQGHTGPRAQGSGILHGNPGWTNVLLLRRPPLCPCPVPCLRTVTQPIMGRRGSPRITEAEFLTNPAG